ncbi:MAG TPA: hypothetical protein VHB30_00665 [Solirubrobacteraceae bacterium]|nr:hypothetical protein [Solirubrobacteraceae bacterium]
MSRPVFLVGTTPFDPTESLERFASVLAEYAHRLPDGQQYGWLPNQVFENTDGLVPGNDEPLQPTAVTSTFRPAPGVSADQLRFEAIHYADAAIAGHAVFARLRDEDKVPPGARYQMSIPTPFTSCIFFDWDVVRDVWPVYEQQLFANVARMCAAIPHEDLAISWDVVAEFMIFAGARPREDYSLDELIAGIARALDAVPADVEAGLHFCYGGHNSNGNIETRSAEHQAWLTPALRELRDTELMTRYFNEIKAKTHRSIQWVHMPVPHQHEDEEYFAPLAELDLGDTELYLGLVHLSDGIERTSRKIAAAEHSVPAFGVAAACGLHPIVSGLDPEQVPAMIDYHRQVASIGETTTS